MKKNIVIALLVFCFSCVTEVSAQVFSNPVPPQINISNQIWRNFRIGQIGNQIAADMARANTLKKSKAQSAANPKMNRPSASMIYSKQLSFVRSPKSPLAEKFLQISGASNSPLTSEQINRLLQHLWNAYQTSFKEENERLKMPFDDVATALTYFISINYLISRNLPLIEAEKSVAIYKQIADTLLKNPEFSKISSEEKQLMAEVLVMLGGFPEVAFSQNRNFEQRNSMANENLARIFGTNAQNLKITDNGLEF